MSDRGEISIRWFTGSPPGDLVVTQVSCFCFDPSGQLLLIEDQGDFSLPGGHPEPGESFEITLRREVYEEARVTLVPESIHLIGYRLVEHGAPAGDQPRRYAQLRMLARIASWHPVAPDPATGKTYRRVLVGVAAAPALLGWGREAEEQVDAANRLARHVWKPAN